MELHAVKIFTPAYHPTRWDLREVGTETSRGFLLFNPHGKFFTVQVNSRYTDDVLACEMFEGDDCETRKKALQYAREKITQEEPPTRESLTLKLEAYKAARYQDEMSDDYAYSNGKYAYWSAKIQKVENMLKAMGE